MKLHSHKVKQTSICIAHHREHASNLPVRRRWSPFN